MLTALAWALKSTRRQANVSQWEIAALAGVDETTVQRLERGRAWPRQLEELVNVYARAAGIHPQEIWLAAAHAWKPNGA